MTAHELAISMLRGRESAALTVAQVRYLGDLLLRELPNGATWLRYDYTLPITLGGVMYKLHRHPNGAGILAPTCMNAADSQVTTAEEAERQHQVRRFMAEYARIRDEQGFAAAREWFAAHEHEAA